jgi:hypothetical protein
MNRLFPVAMLAAAALVFAAPAQSGAPTNGQLARQIKTLQKQVKTLKKQVRDARLLALGGIAYSGCSIAVTADAFQGTWGVIDEVSGRAPPPRTWFGPQVPVNDYGLCTAFEFTRTPNKLPPDTSVFSAMLAIFRG